MITRTTVLSHPDGDTHLTLTGTPSQVEYLQARIKGLFATKGQLTPGDAPSDASNFAALFATLRRDR